MASVHKSPRSPYWIAAFYGAQGQRCQRSTKQTNRNAALRIAIEWETAAGKAKHGLLTELQCRKVLSDLLEATTGDSIRSVSTGDFIADWLCSKEATKSEKTVARYRFVCGDFEAALGTKSRLPINAITTHDIQAYLDGRMSSGRSPKTVSCDKKVLSALFMTAHRRGLIQVNPVHGTEQVRVMSQEREAFTPAQIAMLINAASGDWKTCILLGYFTGARLQDCSTMQWESVDLVGGTITFHPEKTKIKKVVVPIHPGLESHLHSIAPDTAQPFICPSLAGMYSGGRGLSYQFKMIVREAGIDPKTVRGTGSGKSFSKLTFHSLRHAFNSELANGGVSQEIRMKLTGHSSTAVNTGYTHHELQVLRQGIGVIPKVSE